MSHLGPTPSWPHVPGEMADRIRAFDWSRTPLGGIDTWTERCRNVVDMVLASGFPTIALVGREAIQIYNDRYRDLMGEKHPAGLGQPTRECWPEVWHLNEPIHRRVLAGETVTLEDEIRPLIRDGDGTPRDAWFTLSFSPLRETDGSVADILATAIETTERVRMQNALRTSEARLAAVLDSLPVGVGVTDAEGEFLLVNEAMKRFVPTSVMPSRDDERRNRWRAVDSEGRDLEPRDFPGARALRGERVVPGLQMLHTGDDGQEVWTSVATVPIRDATGRIAGHASVIHDIDAVKRAEERQAFLLVVSDALRSATSAVEIQATVARLLGEHLRGDRTYYSEIDSAGQRVVVQREYNPAGAPSLIREHSFAFSRPLLDVHPTGRPFVSNDVGADPRFDEVRDDYEALAIGSLVRAPLIRNGRLVASLGVTNVAPRKWTDAEVTLIADVAERTWDAIERARTADLLRESEARFRAFVTASSDVVYRMSEDWSEMRQLDGRGFLTDTPEPSGDWLHRYIHPDDQPTVRDAIDRAIQTKSMFELEHQVRRADGSLGWTHSRAVPIINEAGDISEWFGAAKDVTDRREAEARLRTSEELFRSFAENSTDTLWIVDAAQGRLDYLSPAFAAMFGMDPVDVMAELGRFLDLVHPDDRSRVADAMPTLLSGGKTYQVEYRIVRPDNGAIRWLQDTGFPIRDAGGRIERAGGIVQDVTGRREAEETLRSSEKELQVMVAELHHRTRNLIGVVGMIMRQVLASSSSLADFRARYTERLEALSRVQSLLSRPRDERIGIGDIVRLELDALGADLTSDRVQVEGEPVVLRKSTVQTLALAIHELATNARKYGALYADAGVLAVRWAEYRTETGRRRLRFEWTETGIDATVEETVGPMHRGGYGRELIENALPYTLKARTTYTLGEDRLDCTVDMPLDG